MNSSALMDIGMLAMITAAQLSAPILLTALTVGFCISLFQSITQIQEPTLAFVPKAVAVAVVLLISGNWMISVMVGFTHALFDKIPSLLSGG